MKISIITVSYNAEKTIEKTIKSVMKIKDDSIEYILMDGDSSDRTMEIVNKYADVFDVIISEKDDGLWDALNKGIRIANGDYIMMLAADDILLPDAIQNFKKSLKENTDVWSADVIMKCFYGYEYMKSEEDLDKLYNYCSLRHPATFFKKAVYDEYGYYDTRYKCAGDREFFLRLHEEGVVFQIENYPIVLFEGGGLSTDDPTKCAIPEDKEISVRYGMDNNVAEFIYGRKMKKYKPCIWKKIGKIIIFKTYIYDLLCILLNKENKRVPRKVLKKYGIR